MSWSKSIIQDLVDSYDSSLIIHDVCCLVIASMSCKSKGVLRSAWDCSVAYGIFTKVKRTLPSTTETKEETRPFRLAQCFSSVLLHQRRPLKEPNRRGLYSDSCTRSSSLKCGFDESKEVFQPHVDCSNSIPP
jgi:hypothetical protein